MRFIFFFVLISVFSLLSLDAQVKYIAYEGFDYPLNSPVQAKSGGTGWVKPWEVLADYTGGYLINNSAGSLSYLDVKTSGNFLTGGKDWYGAGRRLNTTEAGPFAAWVEPWSDGIGTRVAPSTIFMSAILGKMNSNADDSYLDLHENDLPWYNYATNLNRIGVGYFGAASDVAGIKHWSLRIDNEIYDTGVLVAIGAPSLFVVKLEFGAANTTVSVYINPSTIGNQVPASPTIVKDATTRHCVRSIALYLGQTPNNGVIDEIRFGASFESVVPNSSTNINLPPTASYTISSKSGKTPLTVTFDATSSSDPEGRPLTYKWNFGDGTSSATGQLVSHTYDIVGVMAPTLTVTDDVGTANTANDKQVTVYDDNNTMPCYPTIQVIKMASCGNNDGDIKVTVPTACTMVLKNSSGDIMPQTVLNDVNSKEYKNLAPGPYDLYLNGTNLCTDYKKLFIVTDSTTCPGWVADKSSMRIGTNVTSLADWSVERPFRNLMKNVRNDLIPYLPSNSSIWSTDYPVNNHTINQMSFDQDGYPIYLPQTTNVGNTSLRYVISSNSANLVPGNRYVLLYDGTGTFELPGINIASSSPGRIVFDASSWGTVSFNLSYSKQGDNVRNIRVLPIADEFVDLNANTFTPQFLEKIAPFASLRFMEWGNVNGNPIVSWNERNTVNRWTYYGFGGVPFEMIIKLANQTKKDIWICVPHLADDNYVTQMATMFRDQLDPSLKIYVEYSNELWNWTFSQSHWNIENKPTTLSYGRAAAEKAKRVFKIWSAVFGGQTERIKRLLGVQGGFTELSEEIMSELQYDDFDLVSTSFYYSLDHADAGSIANPVLTASSSAVDILTNSRNKWNRELPMMKRLYNCAKLYGKSVIGYEGGQHFVGVTGGVTYPYTEKMYDSQTIPEMYQLYSDVLTDIRNLGCVMAMNYSLAGPQRSQYGSWGALSDVNLAPPYMSTAPKYQALLDNISPKSNVVDAISSKVLNSSLVDVYPNPTKSEVIAKLKNPEDFIKMEIFDSSGRFLVQSNKSIVSLKDCQGGLYFVKVQTSKGAVVKRVVKVE